MLVLINVRLCILGCCMLHTSGFTECMGHHCKTLATGNMFGVSDSL